MYLILLTNQTLPPQRSATILLKYKKTTAETSEPPAVLLIGLGHMGVNMQGEQRLDDWEGF